MTWSSPSGGCLLTSAAGEEHLHVLQLAQEVKVPLEHRVDGVKDPAPGRVMMSIVSFSSLMS